MTTAELVVEALDTVGVLLRAGATWFVLLAAVASIALYAVVTVVWLACLWAWTTVRNALSGRMAGQEATGEEPEAEELPEPPQRRTRRVPAWACQQPIPDNEFEEAA